MLLSYDGPGVNQKYDERGGINSSHVPRAGEREFLIDIASPGLHFTYARDRKLHITTY